MFGQTQASTGFGFGQSSAPAFGGSSAPAFGAGSTTAFGAPSTPAFGAATSAPAFGAATSTPAFGTSSAPAFGAGSSTPAFGANTGGGFGFSSAAPAFGATSAPAFGTSSTASFSFSSTPALGASSAGPFGQSAPQPTLFGQQQQPAQQAQQQQQVPFTRASTFETLPKEVQSQLQQIQAQISQYETDRLKVQHLPHLQEAPAHQQGLNAEIAAVRGELKELSALIKTQEEGLQDFKEKTQQLLKATDRVVSTFTRNKEFRVDNNSGQLKHMSVYMTLPPMLPGPYLEEAVQGMAQTVAEHSRVLDEVEQVLATSSLQDPSQVDWRTVLPTIVSNMHDYFIAVAAKLEKTHSEVERLKSAHLAKLRSQGNYNDPFERARRQEQQQQQQLLLQQRQSPVQATQQHHAVPAAGAALGTALALPAPQAGNLFGGQAPAATPAPQAGPAPFGSPFPGPTAFGASPFGGAQNNSGLSRSTSKPKSKKR